LVDEQVVIGQRSIDNGGGWWNPGFMLKILRLSSIFWRQN